MNLLLLLFICLNFFNYRYDNQIDAAQEIGSDSDDRSFEEGLQRSRYRQREKKYETPNANQTEEEDLQRRDVIFLYGFDKSLYEGDLRYAVVNMFQNEMGVDIQSDDIIMVKTITAGKSKKPPIVVKFISEDVKELVLQKQKSLPNAKYIIEDYLPKSSRQKQKYLFPIMRRYRELGKFAVVRDGKLIVDGEVKVDTKCQNFEEYLVELNKTLLETRDVTTIRYTTYKKKKKKKSKRSKLKQDDDDEEDYPETRE